MCITDDWHTSIRIHNDALAILIFIPVSSLSSDSMNIHSMEETCMKHCVHIHTMHAHRHTQCMHVHTHTHTEEKN